MNQSDRTGHRTFEDEVRRIARALWPDAEYQGAQKIMIFTALSKDEIEALPGYVNTWIENNVQQIVNIQTSMCQVAEEADGERYQCLTLTILYD